VKDCLSFDGDVIGEGPVLLGGVEGLPIIVVGEPGEEGRLKGEVRGELKERAEGLKLDAWIITVSSAHCFGTRTPVRTILNIIHEQECISAAC
jgi:hypothetical protein